MEAKKYGNGYRISYKHPEVKNTIHEFFTTKEEADLRIAQIQLDKKLGTFTPPKKYIDSHSSPNLLRETMTVAQLLDEYIKLHALQHWSVGTLREKADFLRITD